MTLFSCIHIRTVLDIILPALSILLLAGDCFAANFVRIKIYPENVGVFTTVNKQQFVAVGIRADGSAVNITKKVNWKSSNPAKVTINWSGLARVVPGTTWGQVKISCSYPKTKVLKNRLAGPYLLLLGGLTQEESKPPPVNLFGPYLLLLGNTPEVLPLAVQTGIKSTSTITSYQQTAASPPRFSIKETKPSTRREYVTLPQN